MTDKFTIKQQAKAEGYRAVMVDIATYEMLVEMKEQTGVSLGKLLQSAVQFAFERFEVEE
nr:hypothetical protein [uncultured Cellulosilyticum sp.]